MSRKPEDDHLLDHHYDGIQEYDNPLPRWWVYLFWATILFSLLYVLNLPGIGVGKGRIASYEREMAEARAKYGDRLAAGASMSEPELLALVGDALEVKAGKACFDLNCMPCHRADGGGMIGPNLTDVYWIHGGRPLEVMKTVREGVPQKGMPAWGQVLKPEQVASVTAYVLSLQGSNPANPKAPEGLPADSVATSAGSVPATERVKVIAASTEPAGGAKSAR